MPDPLIHVPEPKARAAGFWLRNRATGEMHFVDAHAEEGSAVWTAWPVMTRWKSYFVERAVDSALSAAGGTLGQAERFFEGWRPSRFFDQVFGNAYSCGPGTADFSIYFGHDGTSTRSRAGLVVDDSDDGTSVTGFPRHSAHGDYGYGPGAGAGSSGTGATFHAGHGLGAHESYANQTGGPFTWAEWAAFPLADRISRRGGMPVDPAACITAVRLGQWDRDTLAMGGSGGVQGTDDDSGAGGDGLVRISQTSLTESTNRTLSGGNIINRNPPGASAGYGSGGGYYAISRQGYTLSSGTTIDLRGGLARYASATNGAGDGMMVLFTVDDPTISGTLQVASNATSVQVHWQIYPSIPFGGALVSG